MEQFTMVIPAIWRYARRLIEGNLKLIDVVVEILDARIPFSGRNPHFDDIIKNKPRLLVLNKADLADKNRTKLWIDWYAEQGLKVIPISCTTGMGINTVLAEARALIQDKIDRERERGQKPNFKNNDGRYSECRKIKSYKPSYR